MTSSRRHLVYVLHDGSANTTRRLSSLLKRLREDPYALETVWLSFICLSGKAKQIVSLKEIEVIGEPGVVGAEDDAPDLNGALSIFEVDVDANFRRTTATTKGDWRPVLVLVMDATPRVELSHGLDSLNGRKLGLKLAFLGRSVSPLSRARLVDGGFEVFDVRDGVVQTGADGSPGRFWEEVLSEAITLKDAVRAPEYGLPPPPVDVDHKIDPVVEKGSVAVPNASDVGERRHGDVTSNSSGEIFPRKFFDLSADGRLTRSGLLGCLMLCMGLLSVAFCINMFSVVFSAVIATIALLALSFGFVRRAHDVGLSGWFLLIPLLNLWLMVAPGQAEDNKFGRNPRSRTKN